MLIALLTMMILGGTPTALLGDIASVQDSVKEVMPKNDQRKAALDVLKRMEKATKDRNKQVDDFSDDVEDMLKVHDADIDELDRIWADYHATRSAFQIDLIDLRFELKEQVSREQWNEIFADG